MIITEFYDGQGLGNQLWVYTAARSLAEHLGLSHVILGRDRFKGRGFLEIEGEFSLPTGLSLDTIKILSEELFYDQDLDYLASDFDERMLNIKGPTRIEGLFQSERYFFGSLEKLKHYLRLDGSIIAKNSVAASTCIINLRGGEYKRHKRFILPREYWQSAMREMTLKTGVKDFLVVTDDVRYAEIMFPKLPILQGGIGDCYATLFNAQYLIVSNSSFSYFPVKTGIDKSLVIAPKYWARYNSNLQRWASPANLYESWQYLDKNGHLSSYSECVGERDELMQKYQGMYNIRVPSQFLHRPKVRRFIPKPIRQYLKRTLSLLFPAKYG